MKKIFTFILASVMVMSLSSYVMAEGEDDVYVFHNPLQVTDCNGIDLQFFVTSESGLPMPYDTIMPIQAISLGLAVVTDNYDEKEEIIEYPVSMGMVDFYGKLVDTRHVTVNKETLDNSEAIYSEKTSTLQGMTTLPERAGHYAWIIGIDKTDSVILGTTEFDRDQVSYVWGESLGKQDKVFNTKPLTLMSKIYSGYPYDVTKFQGKAHYEVYDPDSVNVFSGDFQLNASNDSTLLEYIKQDTICTVDSAKEGIYLIALTGAWLEKEQVFRVTVTDPLKDASSKNVVDATFRVKASDFSEKTRNLWNYSGSAKAEYAKGKGDEPATAIFVKKSDASDDESFNISQKVTKMPAGWYQLKWHGYYQPSRTDSMFTNMPILATISANKENQSLAHVYDVAQLTTENDYATLRFPITAKSAGETLQDWGLNKINFQVGKDSTITLGADVKTSQFIGAATALGRVELFFHGTGLPYGMVSPIQSDSIYTAQDSIKYQVDLVDGIGQKITEENNIILYIVKGENISMDVLKDPKNVLLQAQMDAPKAGEYILGAQLPEGDSYTNGVYSVVVASAYYGDTYQVLERFKIGMQGGKDDATKVENVAAKIINSGATYDLSGKRVTKNATKGIYIADGKKTVK